MTQRSWIIAVIALAAAFIAGWWFGRRTVIPEIVETVRIDTVAYEKPQPYREITSTVSVRLPRLLFAPADTVNTVIVMRDSVEIELPFERREYRDSTYYAVVSGISVGGYRPTLESIETYNKTITRTQTVRDPYKWEVSATGFAGTNLWAGGQVTRHFGPLSVSGIVGYDFRERGMVGQVQASFALWRR